MDVQQLWWLSLGISALVIVVVAALLGLIVASAKSIDRHAAGIWTVGKQIAGGTVSIWMLEESNRLLRKMVEQARQVGQTAADIDTQLQAIARSRERGR